MFRVSCPRGYGYICTSWGSARALARRDEAGAVSRRALLVNLRLWEHEPEPVLAASATCATGYTLSDPYNLLDLCLLYADIRLVRLEYLRSLAKQGRVWPRCQKAQDGTCAPDGGKLCGAAVAACGRLRHLPKGRCSQLGKHQKVERVSDQLMQHFT